MMEFQYIVGSDVIRDGMFVEIQRAEIAVGEIFCPFEREEAFLSLFAETVPLEAIERAIEIVREQQLIGR